MIFNKVPHEYPTFDIKHKKGAHVFPQDASFDFSTRAHCSRAVTILFENRESLGKAEQHGDTESKEW